MPHRDLRIGALALVVGIGLGAGAVLRLRPAAPSVAEPADSASTVVPTLAPSSARPTARAREPAMPAPSAPRAPVPVAPPAGSERASDPRTTIDRATREYLDTMTVPAGVAAEAKALHVSPEALRAMYATELLLHERGDTTADPALRAATDQSLRALAGFGDEGFRALVANVIGNPENTSRGDAIAAAVWRPGLEEALLERLRALPAGLVATAPLRALGAMDAPATRAYLKDALRTYADHASNFASAAEALGALHEEDAADAIAAKLRVPSWSGLRASLLDSLGGVGGPRARAALLDWLRDPQGDHESHAARALARLDPAAARAEADAIVRGSSPNRATPAEVAALQAFLAGP